MFERRMKPSRSALMVLRKMSLILCVLLLSVTSRAQMPSISDADELLNAIDKASGNLHDFTANMRYTKEQGLLGDIQTRTGKLYYLNDAETGVRKFFVHFIELRMGDTVEKESHDFIFDGRWLVERINDEKQFIRRERSEERRVGKECRSRWSPYH